MNLQLAVDARNSLGEGPTWCHLRNMLWWVDIDQPRLWSWTPGSGDAQSWPLPKPAGSVHLLEDGRLLIAFRASFGIWNEADASVEFLPFPDIRASEERFNDAKVDPSGRLWIGTMDRKAHRPVGALYRFDAPQGMVKADQGFCISNGIGWSPDLRSMYFAETQSRRIYRYAFNATAGSLGPRELFVEVPAGDGEPDGLTTDTQGGVWCAMFHRGCIHRYLPDGSLDRVLELPASRPTSCAFGGEDLRTLFITTATFGLDAAEREREPWAGGLLALRVPEQGMQQVRMKFPLVQDAIRA